MQRTITLEPNERRTLAALEMENTQTLAQIGSFMLDLEAAKARLATIQEKQRSFLRNAMEDRKLAFNEARVVNGNIIAELPDEPLAPQATAAESPAKVNGGLPTDVQ